MKKLILSWMTFIMLSLTMNAQEMLRVGDKKYVVADIKNIEVINVRASLADELARHSEYSIFSEALEKTGLADTISAWNKDKYYDVKNNTYPADFQNSRLYYPTVNYIKFTVFAVDDETFRTLGVTDFNSLKAKCVEWYGGASEWYDYPGKGSETVSTGEDYEYTYNVVNMFVRYHILKAGMRYDDLVLNGNRMGNYYWNFAFGGEPYNYYETLLPHTIMKLWQPLYHNTGNATNIWINRYVANNTLTDQIGLFGSDEMHQLIDAGALVDSTKSDIKAINGYIHNVSKPLVYSAQVAHGVLNERLRIDVSDMLYELSNNGLRYVTYDDISKKYGCEGVRCIFNNDYFDYLSVKGDSGEVVFHGNHSTWRAWNAELMQVVSEKDVEVFLRVPPVPTGEYELRTSYAPSSLGWESVQAYIGTEPNMDSMMKLGSEYSTMLDSYANIGFVSAFELTDYGVASDSVMRTNGYMRMPASFSRGQNNSIKEPVTTPQTLLDNVSGCVRYEDLVTLRKILGTVSLQQDKEYWLGFKLTNGLSFWLDFLELVPTSVINNTTYTEDWY